MIVHRLFPWLDLRQGRATPPKLTMRARKSKHRRISQEAIDAMRAEYESLPLGHGGRRERGVFARLGAKYGIGLHYVRNILYLGLRDTERE